MTSPDQTSQTAQPSQPSQTPQTPAAAWQRLAEGNERFAAGLAGGADTGSSRRLELTTGQQPFALVLGCSDSRVPVEIVFDQGLGDLFVVRTAGHVVGTTVLGSVEYGVVALGVRLVVVMGHEACGAVAATMASLREGTVPSGYVRDIVERITPSVLATPGEHRDEAAAVGAQHVRATASRLLERSAALATAVRDGRCAVTGVTYGLATGRVSIVDGGAGGPEGADTMAS